MKPQVGSFCAMALGPESWSRDFPDVPSTSSFLEVVLDRAPLFEHAGHKNKSVVQINSSFDGTESVTGGVIMSERLDGMPPRGKEHMLLPPLARESIPYHGTLWAERHLKSQATTDAVNSLWDEDVTGQVSRGPLEEPPLVFVNMQGKLGTRDLASSTQIKSNPKGHSKAPMQSCGSNPARSAHRPLAPGSDGLAFGQGTSAPQSMLIGPINAQAGVSMVCKQCGKTQIISLTPDQTSTLPREIISGGSLGPFMTLPMTVNHQMHELIHHYFFVHGPKINAYIYGKDNLEILFNFWVLQSTGDASVLYALFAQAARAGEFVSIQGNEAAPEEVRCCWRSIEQRLHVNRCNVVHHSRCGRQYRAAESPLCRNGENGTALWCIDTLSKVLAHAISRVDSNAAWTQQTKPMFSMYKSNVRDPASMASIFGYKLPRSPFVNRRFEDFLWDDLFPGACDLFYISHLLDLYVSAPGTLKPIEREYFEDTYAACNHDLAAFPLPRDVLAKTAMYYRQHCWRIAAFLYINTAIRKAPSPQIINSMTLPLIEAFQETEPASSWYPYADILLWVFIQGYCGACEPCREDGLFRN
ncbi:uncharacterized protein PAC_08560 [Phialocephala subalpina]|uniref:Uncharacterized protein n=1 Tax=Phialocephala subalpina TaxID=576137 RepID=A0A1L7X0W7_9HELO|nr:uncharacterized protein PAC_08560 [Phialocephala subalpina]